MQQPYFKLCACLASSGHLIDFATPQSLQRCKTLQLHQPNKIVQEPYLKLCTCLTSSVYLINLTANIHVHKLVKFVQPSLDSRALLIKLLQSITYTHNVLVASKLYLH